jgi:hypothetical protein
VAEDLRAGTFSIRTSRPGTRVSWLVTGVRHDAWAERNRIPVELDKGPDRGRYLFPEGFGKPDSFALGE